MKPRISGASVVLPIPNADLRTEVDGTIEEVYVDEGNWIHAGDAVARLSDREFRIALLKTDADLDQMGAQLRLLQAGPRPQEIEMARIAVARAEKRTAFETSNLAREKEVFDLELLSL